MRWRPLNHGLITATDGLNNIGGIYGDLHMAQAFLACKPGVGHVSLGDIVDSRIP